MKEQYAEAIKETGLILSDYRRFIESSDMGGLDNLKHRLRANKLLLNALLCDWNNVYRQRKRELTKLKEEKYLFYRKQGWSQRDADNHAKLDTIPQLEATDEAFAKKEKISNLVHDAEDLIIEICVILKQNANEIKYG